MCTIFSDETEENLNTAMLKLRLELVSDPGQMLNILSESKLYGTAVGINAPSLGNDGIYITAVDDILIDEDITIVLKNYDITGYILERNKLALGEIKGVFPFKSAFENPFMRDLRQSKLRA